MNRRRRSIGNERRVERDQFPSWVWVATRVAPDRGPALGVAVVLLLIAVATIWYAVRTDRHLWLSGAALVVVAGWIAAAVRWVDRRGRWER